MANAGISLNSTSADAKRSSDQPQRSRDELHFLRALSHDMSANSMLLDDSFRRLKASLAKGDRAQIDSLVEHVEACLCQSRQFLDDLAQLARTGAVSMEPARVEVGEVVEEVLFEQREILTQRQVQVDVHPLRAVWCNRHRLKQVLTNLIRNAVQHGCDRQRPRITLSAESPRNRVSPAGQPLVAIRVHDNGPGIEARYREEIFLPGRRINHPSEDGSGMGLAIVRRVAEEFGGSATVESCPRGTAFVVELPAPREPSIRQLPGRYPEETSEIRRIEHDAPHDEQHPHHRSERRRSRSSRRG